MGHLSDRADEVGRQDQDLVAVAQLAESGAGAGDETSARHGERGADAPDNALAPLHGSSYRVLQLVLRTVMSAQYFAGVMMSFSSSTMHSSPNVSWLSFSRQDRGLGWM